jgi:hypothetical protein
MAYDVAADEREAIVRVSVRGPATREEHRAARREAAQLCRERGWPRMLVDLRELETAGVVSTTGCYDFGRSYREDNLPTQCCIAHVLPAGRRAREDVEFTATVAVNRGITIRDFTDIESARQWLAQFWPDARADGPKA